MVFPGGWSHRPSPGMNQTSRVPEEKQMFNINDIVFIMSLTTRSLSFQGTIGNLLKSKFPDISRGSTLEAGLSKDSKIAISSLNTYKLEYAGDVAERKDPWISAY